MGVAAQSMRDMHQQISGPSESKEDVKNILAQGEPTKDVTEIPAVGAPMVKTISPFNKIEGTMAGNVIKPTATRRLSQVILDKMKAALLDTPRQVKLPSGKPLRPISKTVKPIRKVKRPRGPPIPASVNTIRKPRSDGMQTADKGLTNEGTEPMCNDIFVLEDDKQVLGDVQIKIESLDI
ncbi:hypothetical protein HA402_011192 [Bradysia odoriphaga]|nr:hypothetical protein HA402_011192 [Bradysia odoriphaga]